MHEHNEELSPVAERVNPSPYDPNGAAIFSGSRPHIGQIRLRMSELRSQMIRFHLSPDVIGMACC